MNFSFFSKKKQQISSFNDKCKALRRDSLSDTQLNEQLKQKNSLLSQSKKVEDNEKAVNLLKLDKIMVQTVVEGNYTEYKELLQYFNETVKPAKNLSFMVERLQSATETCTNIIQTRLVDLSPTEIPVVADILNVPKLKLIKTILVEVKDSIQNEIPFTFIEAFTEASQRVESIVSQLINAKEEVKPDEIRFSLSDALLSNLSTANQLKLTILIAKHDRAIESISGLISVNLGLVFKMCSLVFSEQLKELIQLAQLAISSEDSAILTKIESRLSFLSQLVGCFPNFSSSQLESFHSQTTKIIALLAAETSPSAASIKAGLGKLASLIESL